MCRIFPLHHTSVPGPSGLRSNLMIMTPFIPTPHVDNLIVQIEAHSELQHWLPFNNLGMDPACLAQNVHPTRVAQGLTGASQQGDQLVLVFVEWWAARSALCSDKARPQARYIFYIVYSIYLSNEYSLTITAIIVCVQGQSHHTSLVLSFVWPLWP
jgi:hypothetical protein